MAVALGSSSCALATTRLICWAASPNLAPPDSSSSSSTTARRLRTAGSPSFHETEHLSSSWAGAALGGFAGVGIIAAAGISKSARRCSTVPGRSKSAKPLVVAMPLWRKLAKSVTAMSAKEDSIFEDLYDNDDEVSIRPLSIGGRKDRQDGKGGEEVEDEDDMQGDDDDDADDDFESRWREDEDGQLQWQGDGEELQWTLGKGQWLEGADGELEWRPDKDAEGEDDDELEDYDENNQYDDDAAPKASSAAEEEVEEDDLEAWPASESDVSYEEDGNLDDGALVTDDEVNDFLAEIGSSAKVQRVPEGQIEVDPYEHNAAQQLDLFEELGTAPDRRYIYEQGLPGMQRPLTLKDRVMLIAEYADEGNWKEARFLMRRIWSKKRLRLPLGRIMWNLMIKAHVRAGRPKAAESWVVDMLDRVYQPDIISYNTLLQAYAQNGNYLRASYWMRRMEARGVKPDALTFSALAHSYATAGELEGAQRAVLMMHDAGIRPRKANPVAYNAALKICASTGKLDAAERWAAQMMEWQVNMDEFSFLLLMRTCAQAGEPERAKYWLDFMQEKGFMLRSLHYHAVASAYSQKGALPEVRSYLQKMQAAGAGEKDTAAYNLEIGAAAEQGDLQEVEAILATMQEAGLDPDTSTAIATLQAAFAGDDAEGGRRWFFAFEDAGVEMDVRCYNFMIQSCLSSGDARQAERYMRRLLRRSMSPDAQTYTVLLDVLAKAGEASAAEFWLDHMQRTARWRYSEFPLSQIQTQYTFVLAAHVNAGNLQAAEAWVEQMMGQGVEPNRESYSHLIRGHLSAGDEVSADKWRQRSQFLSPVDETEAETLELAMDASSR